MPSVLRVTCLASWIGAIVVNAFSVPIPKTSIGSSALSSPSLSSLQAIREIFEDPLVNRRDSIKWSGISLAALLLGMQPGQQPANAEEAKTILITGCNSGIGFEAATTLAAQGHTLILANRSLKKSLDTVERIRSKTSSGTLIPQECNLASLQSIQSFAENLPTKTVDIVCFNAGVSLNVDDKKVQRTEDGFEMTVGTNHLGHFYLNQLLLPRVQPKGGRIVVTASEVHDPNSGGGSVGIPATLGTFQGFERDGKFFEMVDGSPYDGDKAYKDSKLCNILFTRELQRRIDAEGKDITVNCFSPGLITKTGLFRNQNPFFIKAFDLLATNVAKFNETPEWGGASLVYVTSRSTKAEYYVSPPGSSKYGDAAFGNQFKASPPSEEARDGIKGKRLWELSEKLVGLKA